MALRRYEIRLLVDATAGHNPVMLCRIVAALPNEQAVRELQEAMEAVGSVWVESHDELEGAPTPLEAERTTALRAMLKEALSGAGKKGEREALPLRRRT